jgi:REP element-mobilizing transposase RayT
MSMTSARKELFDVETPGVYHCYTRCVRRAFLCGVDKLTGKDYSHRKDWVKDRIEFLESIFFIANYAFAVMCNHTHLILANRPDQMNCASDEEIARRWLTLFPRPGSKGVPQQHDIDELVANKTRIAELRNRLGDISWFMRCLNERIARRANKEDGVTGRFFEGRFKCTALEDEASILACMVYVDLNEIRAKIASTPETSKFTSAYARIMARTSTQAIDSCLAPIEATDDGSGIFSDMTHDEYLLILDQAGRQQAEGKGGAIPDKLAPILSRLGIEPPRFYELTTKFDEHFFRVAGKLETMREVAQRKGKSWFVGLSSAKMFFA